MNARAIVQICGAQIGGDHARSVAVPFDELRGLRAARERLDAERTRAGKQIEHPRPRQRSREVTVLVRLEAALVGQRFEHREDRALDQVSRRPCLGGGAQGPAASRPRNYTHSSKRRSARVASVGNEIGQVSGQRGVLG